MLLQLSQGSDEKTCYKALEILNPDLYAPNCTDDTNALHHTAAAGFTAVSKEILARGFHRLLGEKGYSPIIINDKYGQLHPASIAVQTAHFATAKELLQAMEQRYIHSKKWHCFLTMILVTQVAGPCKLYSHILQMLSS